MCTIAVPVTYRRTFPTNNSPVRKNTRYVSQQQAVVVGSSPQCDMTERARRAATFKILRASGIDLMHKQAYMMAKLIEELRREQQHMVDFANGVM